MISCIPHSWITHPSGSIFYLLKTLFSGVGEQHRKDELTGRAVPNKTQGGEEARRGQVPWGGADADKHSQVTEKHPHTTSSVVENLTVAILWPASPWLSGHQAVRCTRNISQILPSTTLKFWPKCCRAQHNSLLCYNWTLFLTFSRWNRALCCAQTVCCYEMTFMNSSPTQTASDVLPDPSVRPLFSSSVWSGRNSWLIPYNNITDLIG